LPRNGSGTYTLPQPAFVPNTIITSSSVNSDLSDIATALSNSISADGQTTITGQLKFPTGSAGAPSHTFASDIATGMYLVSAGVLGFATAGIQSMQVAAGTTTITGNLSVTGTISAGGGGAQTFTSLVVTGTTTLATTNIGGITTITGTNPLTLTGGNLAVGGNTVLSGLLTVGSTSTLAATGVTTLTVSSTSTFTGLATFNGGTSESSTTTLAFHLDTGTKTATGAGLNVTLNKMSGTITTESLAIAQASKITYTINNSDVAANDIVMVNVGNGTNNLGHPVVSVVNPAGGSFTVDITNTGSSTTSGTLLIFFMVLKN